MLSVGLKWFCLVLFVMGAMVASAVGRIERDLDTGWKFMTSDIPGAEASRFDDAKWESIRLPHAFDVADVAGSGPYFRGPAWYRRHLQVGNDLKGRNLYLRFGAASLVAQVYVNGQLAGQHKGGFAAFCIPISAFAHAGDNIIAVRVDNSRQGDVAPLSGDFTVYGGLYRDVTLLALSPVCISPMDDGGPGLYVTTKISGNMWSVSMKALVTNTTLAQKSVKVRFRVTDREGSRFPDFETTESVEANETRTVSSGYLSPSPHLWNGRQDPYLYRLTADVIVDGKVVDSVEQQFGFRRFRVDSEKGLILNYSAYDMHGVNLHQGRPSVGWAATRAMQDEDYNLVHELGATGVRMAHYQHAPHEYELCDQLGIVVWAELCLVNHATETPEFAANIKQQLRELIKQNYNHPSILFWSMYNEPAIDKKRPNEWSIVPELVKLAHELDPNRLTTGAASAGPDQPLDYQMDLASFNRYWGWYDGDVSLAGAKLQKLHDAAGRSFGMSEFGAGASVQQHEIDPKRPVTTSKWHPEEYQAKVHETLWPLFERQPWMWCKLLWVMFDFPSVGRHEGDHEGINDKGLVTGDRKTKKDAFYYYKAQWSHDPFVYITGRRFDPHPGGPATLKVYSNCEEVELLVNGHSLGSKSGENHVFVWDALLSPGTCRIEARAFVHSAIIDDKVTLKVSASP